MNKIGVFIFLLAILCSCDSDMQDIGGGFEVGSIELQYPNVYYNHAGLIQNEEIVKVSWNNACILVETADKDFVLINRQQAVSDTAYTGFGVEYVTKHKIKGLVFDDSVVWKR